MYRCPKCSTLAHAKQTRKSDVGVHRRYHCPQPSCLHRFSTIETPVGNDGPLERDLNALMKAP